MRRAFALLLLVLCATPGCAGSDASGDGGAAAAASPEARIARVFGSTVRIAAEHAPAVFRGDFDGDGVGDLLVLVRVSEGARRLARDVRVVRPWPGADEDASGGDRLGLAVVHGGAAPGFLLFDPNLVSILDTSAAREAFVADKAEASSWDAEVRERARGDVFVLPTEAGIDTFVYWDGATYRAYQPLELP